MIKVIATGSTGNCYFLETENEILILECGISDKRIKKALGFNISKVVGCLITHEHKDHSKSVNEIMKSGIDVYMSKGTASGIEFKDISYSYRLKYLKHLESCKIGGFLIVPFNTQHDVNEPLGFLIYHKEIGKVLFATDTYYLKSKFQNVAHVLIECNYSEDVLPTLPAWRARTIKSHMSLETLKETLKTWNLEAAKDITLVHISHDNGNPDRFQKEIEEMTGIKTYTAIPGLEIK
ncbi:MBL fold metallo-hydrolase [Clostridium botulinum]|nr:MBL fold metallo-hydrolase [Clostridium botulinum]NFS96500.1 MBL fold metallo-hydrolase [Clostridium botulinum]